MKKFIIGIIALVLMVPAYCHAITTVITQPDKIIIGYVQGEAKFIIRTPISGFLEPENEFENYAQIWISYPGGEAEHIQPPDAMVSISPSSTPPYDPELGINATIDPAKIYESTYLILKYHEKDQGIVKMKSHQFPAICTLAENPQSWDFCSRTAPATGQPPELGDPPYDPSMDPDAESESSQTVGGPVQDEVDPSSGAANADPYASWRTDCSFVPDARVTLSTIGLMIIILIASMAPMLLVRITRSTSKV